MKKIIYFVVTFQLEDIDGIKETNGNKDIYLYEIIDNKPINIGNLVANNESGSMEAIDEWIIDNPTEKLNSDTLVEFIEL
jgi:hypothetical protein